ncbi:hypothetical protein [Shewanella salipaludis]|uniref:Uncharacterized protein n=1 Tax=Shewanella salipaludis TaxID=2723052 RepID=A0A972FS10_9GAMM|nr:hypothetical protein [Shewanella salipaludis]NMH65133.1 hypothetical protein [Shewanella salipaludis]
MKTSITLLLVSILSAMGTMAHATTAEVYLAGPETVTSSGLRLGSFRSAALEKAASHHDKLRLEAEIDGLLAQTGPLSDEILSQRQTQLASDPAPDALAFNLNGL